MPQRSFPVGTLHTVSYSFAREDGTIPTLTECIVDYRFPEDPSSNIKRFTAAQVTQLPTGTFNYQVLLNKPGKWFFRFTGMNATERLTSGDFWVNVDPSMFAEMERFGP